MNDLVGAKVVFCDCQNVIFGFFVKQQKKWGHILYLCNRLLIRKYREILFQISLLLS